MHNFGGGQSRCNPVASVTIFRVCLMYSLLATPPETTYREVRKWKSRPFGWDRKSGVEGLPNVNSPQAFIVLSFKIFVKWLSQAGVNFKMKCHNQVLECWELTRVGLCCGRRPLDLQNKMARCVRLAIWDATVCCEAAAMSLTHDNNCPFSTPEETLW